VTSPARHHIDRVSPPGDPSRSSSALIANTLNAGRLGVRQVANFCLSAATPLTVVTGWIVATYAITGVTGIPLAFLVVAGVLALFTVGFVAMGRSIANAGAFYAYIARGLSRRVGVGAAWLAVASYNLLQVALYGLIGVAAGPLGQQYLGVELPWWVYALCAWLVTLVMGLAKVDLNGKVLAVLLMTEVTTIVVCSVANVVRPGPEGVSFATLQPPALFSAGTASIMIMSMAVLGYIGFESAAVFSEETRNTARTVKAAMYWTIGASCFVYVLASWGMSVAVGPSRIVAAANEQGAELFFSLASDRLGSAIADLARFLLLTSILAALISFHNTVSRYKFALGRERVLPRVLGTTWAHTGSPAAASLVQSALALIVITVYAVRGLDPLVELFYFTGTAGGIGVLTLLLITAVSIVVFFARERAGESLWAARIAPGAAAVLLGVILFVSVKNLDTLLGVDPGHPLTWIIPVGIVTLLALGATWAYFLRVKRPEVFEVIGQGAESAQARVQAVTR
jgi:amino acid transporter